MTTIAYRDGIIAWDSRRSGHNGYITSDRSKKMDIVNGVRFWATGAICDKDAMIALWFGKKVNSPDTIECNLVVWDGANLWFCGTTSEGHFWKDPIPLDEPAAWGSGYAHAITAMDFGATARTAVWAAAKRDSSTGGRINTYRLNR